MRYSQRASVYALGFVVAIIGLFAYVLEEQDMLNGRLTYAMLTVLLLLYMWREVIRIRHAYPQRWLLHPVAVCALMTFVMGFGVTNLLFFLPSESIAILGLVPEVSTAMVKHQYLVLIGAVSLFFGYWSPLAANMTRSSAVARFQRLLLPGTDMLKELTLPILLAIGVGVRLFAMRQGLYGYGGDYSLERLAEVGSYSQYLSIAGSLGLLALVLAALRYFAPESKPKAAYWFWISLLIELFFGFLTGMKSAVVMPIIIAGMCLYLRTGKIPRSWIALSMALIFVAYAVIEPFRMVRNSVGGSLTSVTAIVDVLTQGVSTDSPAAPKHDGLGALVVAVAARSNLSYIGSFGLDYADTHEELPEGSPAFLQDILLAPLHALIPRFAWDSKPLGNLGLWYNQQVMGKGDFSSTAMGPFAYLYFAGGSLSVVIAFFLLGVLQRCLWFFTTPWKSLNGAVLFIALLSTFAIIDSAINGIIINLIRNLPLLLILMHLLVRRRVALCAHSQTLPY